jgi:hypothetical protein
VAIVDVGAHVGTRLGLWSDTLLRPGLEHRCRVGNASEIRSDSVVILVEPNPLNLLSLRSAVERTMQGLVRGAHAHQSSDAPTESQGTARGTIVVEEVAAGHYNGVGVFSVDLDANRNKKEDGNERGYLRLDAMNIGTDTGIASGERKSAGSRRHRSIREVLTLVRTVTSIVGSAPARTRDSLRPITTISILKIDAEGLDALVLYGAHEVLSKTKLIVFECHKLWRERGLSSLLHRGGDTNRSSTTPATEWWRLKEVTEFLAKHGFETYLVGQFYWIPMTPPILWDDVYEDRLEWSNCVAVSSDHPIKKAFSVPPACEKKRPG